MKLKRIDHRTTGRRLALAALALLMLAGCGRDLDAEVAAAEALLLQGQPRAAEAAFREVVLEDPSHALATLGRARAFAELQNWPAAYAWYLRAAALDPASSEAQHGALILEVRGQQWRLARERFAEVAWTDPVEQARTEAAIERGLGNELVAADILLLAAQQHDALLAEAAIAAHRAGMTDQARELLHQALVADADGRDTVLAGAVIERDVVNVLEWLKRHPGDVELTVLGVEVLIRAGRVGEAAEYLGSVEESLAAVPELALLDLEVSSLLGRTAALQEAVAGITATTATWEGVSRYGEGLIALANNDIAAATTALRQAERILPNRGRLDITLGLIALAQDQLATAERFLERGLTRLSYVNRARTALAEVHLRRGHYDDAVSQANRVLAGDADNREAHLVLARARAHQGQLLQAIVLLDAIPTGARQRDDLTLKAQILLQLGRAAEAEAIFERYANETDEALLGYVDALNMQGREAEAQNWLDEQSRPLARWTAAMLALRAGKTNRALELTAGHTERQQDALLRVMALEQAGEFDAALALAINHEALLIRLHGANLLATIGRLQEARDLYQSLRRIAPESSILLNNLAWVLFQLEEDLDEALVFARRAHLLEPDNPNYRATLDQITTRIEEQTYALN